MNANKHPLVTIFEQEAAERIFWTESSAIFIFTDEAEALETSIFLTVSQKNFGGTLTFYKSAIKTGLRDPIYGLLGVETKYFIIVQIIKFNSGKTSQNSDLRKSQKKALKI